MSVVYLNNIMMFLPFYLKTFTLAFNSIKIFSRSLFVIFKLIEDK